MFLVVFGLFAFFLLLIGPLLLFASGRIFRVDRLTFRNAFVTNLLISLLGALITALTLTLRILQMESTLDSVLFFIVGLLIASWIIKKRLETGILRAIGIYLVTTVFGLIAASPIKPFVVQAYKIPSSAMAPTLEVGDHILVWKFIYGIKVPLVEKKLFVRSPDRGDIIIFVYPKDKSKDFLKRVIALPGERIEIVGKEILINDRPIKDPWGYYTRNTESLRSNYGPKVVPPNSLFVMGDNRDNSQDSRYWGFVNMSEVKGRVSSIYFSWDWRARRVRWERIGRAVE